MGLFSFLGSGAVSAVGDTIKSVSEVFTENSENRGQRNASDLISARNQFAQEFTYRTNWFDSIIDGINRLIRPSLALGTIGLFAYCFIDPVSFSGTMTAMALIPEYLWYLLTSIVAFYFSARTFQKHRDGKISIEKVKAVLEHQRELKKLNPQTSSNETDPFIQELEAKKVSK